MILFWVVTGLVLLFGFVVAFGAPYVPSLRKEIREAFEHLYTPGRNDVVVDLGSGDGQVLVEAAKMGAYGYGYELNPILVLIARLRLRSKATIKLADMWSVTLPKETTLVYAFTVTRDSKKLARFLQRQANEQERTIRLMTFGSGLSGFEPVAAHRGHALYEIAPLPFLKTEKLTL